jgi:hypothetical protein
MQENVSPQYIESIFQSTPKFSLPKSTRDARAKLHISRDHDRGTTSYETPGPVYDIPTTLNRSRTTMFGTGKRSNVEKLTSVASSNDLLGVVIRPEALSTTQRSPTVYFGTDSRDEIKNATVLKDHPQTFFGKHSPGPAYYKIPHLVGNEAPKVTIGSRTPILGSVTQTPEDIGPGSYPHGTYCGKPQFESKIENQPVFSFGKSKRPFPGEDRRSISQPLYRKSVIIESLGRQISSTKKSAPRAILGSQSREQWTKIALVLSNRDLCNFPPSSVACRIPAIPSRNEIIKWSS